MAASEARYKKLSGKGKLRKNWTYITQKEEREIPNKKKMINLEA